MTSHLIDYAFVLQNRPAGRTPMLPRCLAGLIISALLLLGCAETPGEKLNLETPLPISSGSVGVTIITCWSGGVKVLEFEYTSTKGYITSNYSEFVDSRSGEAVAVSDSLACVLKPAQ